MVKQQFLDAHCFVTKKYLFLPVKMRLSNKYFPGDLFATKFTKNFNKKHNRWAQKIYVFATFKKITVQKVVKQQLLLQVDF